MRQTATIDPAMEESQATAPARTENRTAKLIYTSGTMKKKRPSAYPHQKPARRASRSSRARSRIRSGRIRRRGPFGRPQKSAIQQHERDALHHVVDRVVVEIDRVDRHLGLLEQRRQA